MEPTPAPAPALAQADNDGGVLGLVNWDAAVLSDLEAHVCCAVAALVVLALLCCLARSCRRRGQAPSENLKDVESGMSYGRY